MADPTEAAFLVAYERHYAALLNYATRRCEAHQARDVVAETFAIAWRRRSEVPFDTVLPWLYRTAGYVIANERRRQKRRGELWSALVTEHTRVDHPADGESGQHGRAVDALATLSPADQEVLRLSAWEGLDGKELAAALGCTRTAAGVRLHRARNRLQRALMQHGPTPPDVDRTTTSPSNSVARPL